MKLDIPIAVRSIAIHNLDIAYREKSQRTGLVGAVKFMNTNAVISNVVNEPALVKQNPVCRVAATTAFMGSGRLTTIWQFDLANARQGKLIVKGDMRNLDLQAVNPVAKNLGMASFDKGRIPMLQFSVRAQELFAVTAVKASYKNLKMTMYRMEAGALQSRDVASLFTNLVLKNDKNGKWVTVHYRRDIKRSMFNLLWKSIFEATKASVEIKK